MNHEKILRYIPFSSHKWGKGSCKPKQAHPYKHKIYSKNVRAWMVQRREPAANELMIRGKKIAHLKSL